MNEGNGQVFIGEPIGFQPPEFTACAWCRTQLRPHPTEAWLTSTLSFCGEACMRRLRDSLTESLDLLAKNPLAATGA